MSNQNRIARATSLVIIKLFISTALLCISLPLIADFIVDDFGEGNDADLADNLCATAIGSCTLRAAIQQANSTSGLDIIEFDSSGTVLLTSGVIDITDSVFIRPGAAPMVTISSAVQSSLLRILSNSTSATLEDLQFTNSAGSAIFVGAGPQVIIRRCVFDGNINASGSVSGGAISVAGETTIDTSEFRNNSSNITSGGAIFLGTSAILTIENSIIEDNSAKNGGGIAVAGGQERLILKDTILQRNHASENGGGIHSQSRVESEGVTLFQNTADGDGGGIWARNQIGGNSIDALKLVGADIHDNTAAGNGGGLFLGSGAGLHNFLLSRSAVWENEATNGGGVFVSAGLNSPVQIANSTIGMNLATTGGGVYLQGGDLDIIHSTIWDNQGEQLRNSISVLASIGNSIIGGYALGALGCDNPPVQLGPNIASDSSCGASLVVDPLLGTITNTGGYAPTQPFADDSPAINAADLALCEAPPISFFDSDGPVRPLAGQCDLGAWESKAIIFLDGFETAN